MFRLVVCAIAILSFSNSFGAPILVTVDLSPKLKSKAKGTSLFLMARNKGQSKGPPIAVRKVAVDKFPLKTSLGEQHKMIASRPFVGPFTVQARLSQSGNAMRASGDLIGQTANDKAIKPGDQITILLNKVVQ